VISIIIPTLNEMPQLATLLQALAEEATSHEVIVVDGGSEDDTHACANAFGALLIQSRRGRGLQLQLGAEVARGDTLLFLHADSQMAVGALAAIDMAFATSSDVIGGNFQLIFDGDTRFSRWLTRFYARIRRHGFYYGDSGIFVRRAVYDKLGGIRQFALMEDYDFVRRLERLGRTARISTHPLVTSSRRFAGRHPVAIVFGWLTIHALFHLGVPTTSLARIYDRQGGHRPVGPNPASLGMIGSDQCGQGE
jgi:rSAM/selenodomain-associated transferase 2